MSALTKAVESDTYIRISWSSPYNNSNDIDAYQILIKQADGTYSELIAECNGALLAIITQQYCDVQMSTLRAAPYSLVYSDLVVAKASA
jgi:hypothetical protein